MQLYKKLSESLIKCLACRHHCQISNGKTGICGVRQNQNKELKLLVYGRPCSIAIDPIEKKPLYHFLPSTEVLSLGTFGCNFKCAFCQNWDMSQISSKFSASLLKRQVLSSKSLDFFSPEKILELATRNKVHSIAYTYNEPTIWTEYAMDIAKLAKEQGVKNVYVSNGYMTRETCDYIIQYLDAINIDLKSFDEDFYLKICKAKLQPVLDNIKYLHDKGLWLEITTLIIPEENDSDDELKQIAKFIISIDKNIPWHLSAFHPSYQMMEKESTSFEKLLRAKEIGLQAGLKYIYIGNVLSGEHNNTYCPECRELLIKRDYMDGEVVGMDKGKCKCGRLISGIF